MKWSIDPASSQALHEQIAANVRRGVADGTLADGDRLPPARELATVLQVNANTVLAAYRRLRSENLLEFRRGRGVRVRASGSGLASVTECAHQLIELGREHGYTSRDLAKLLTTLEEDHS